jgi:hypothetical protein
MTPEVSERSFGEAIEHARDVVDFVLAAQPREWRKLERARASIRPSGAPACAGRPRPS